MKQSCSEIAGLISYDSMRKFRVLKSSTLEDFKKLASTMYNSQENKIRFWLLSERATNKAPPQNIESVNRLISTNEEKIPLENFEAASKIEFRFFMDILPNEYTSLSPELKDTCLTFIRYYDPINSSVKLLGTLLLKKKILDLKFQEIKIDKSLLKKQSLKKTHTYFFYIKKFYNIFRRKKLLVKKFKKRFFKKLHLLRGSFVSLKKTMRLKKKKISIYEETHKKRMAVIKRKGNVMPKTLYQKTGQMYGSIRRRRIHTMKKAKIGRVKFIYRGLKKTKAAFIARSIRFGTFLRKFLKLPLFYRRVVPFGFSRKPAVRRL